MLKLLEKFVNCYDSYLSNLNYGIVPKNYNILYNSYLLLKTKINNPRYIQYYYNNLKCPIRIKLLASSDVNRMISYTLNSSGVLSPGFSWSEIDMTSSKTYNITTSSVLGYNFFYVSIPQDLNCAIHDAMNNLLFNSLIPGNYQFILVGTTTTSKDKVNNVYRKKNVFNTFNPMPFTIKIF